eukprot:CAMPEP_0202790562 /NCGR_PEP_ID=MMETSP1388-20130828/79713_1 /ASSEMBLY_ACC=CAM_ASM_000864 /TAXON_ID=37098 /ORGANISM="Isochrysis sp, Strain CCMP1244" /LENGTH=73 /DNA_ID=CAMNT_0049460297 /DNA_START=154 /DNA_END=371 /DNA_ORIENTATION=-
MPPAVVLARCLVGGSTHGVRHDKTAPRVDHCELLPLEHLEARQEPADPRELEGALPSAPREQAVRFGRPRLGG